MGTRTYDPSAAPSIDPPPEVRAARAVVDRLAAGHEVSARDINLAASTLLAQMGLTDSGGSDPTLAESYRTLLDRGTPVEDRGWLVGRLLAIGPKGTGALDRVLDTPGDDVLDGLLTRPEKLDLVRVAGQPARERVWHMAILLETELRERLGAPDGGGRHPPPAPLPASLIGLAALAARLGRSGSLKGLVGPETPPGPGPDPEGVLRDPAASEEDRFASALALGTKALSPLRSLAANPSQNGLVVAAVTTLAREPGTARTAIETATRLQLDPRTSHVGDAVFDALNDVPPRDDGVATHVDGWLQRSIDSCSAPAILAAAAGRELAVLPHLTRHLVAARRARHFTP